MRHLLEVVVDRLDPHPVARRAPAASRRCATVRMTLLLVQHLVVLEVVHQRHRRDVRIGGQEDGRARHPVRRRGRAASRSGRPAARCRARVLSVRMRVPRTQVHMTSDQAGADQQRHPAAVERSSAGWRPGRSGPRPAAAPAAPAPAQPAPLPHAARTTMKASRVVDHHGAGHRQAIGVEARLSEVWNTTSSSSTPIISKRVDLRHEDLAGLGLGGAA